MKRLLPLLLVPVLLTSCGTIRETLGVEKSGPDEFAVVERAPLTLPPDFNLVPPQPGAPRPQEAQITAQAQNLVIGQSSAEQTGAAATTPATLSGAEQALLSQAGAANVDPAIRKELSNTVDDEEVDGTFAQKLGISGGAESGKALDADKESKRLKKQNIKTPNVPDKLPEAKK